MDLTKHRASIDIIDDIISSLDGHALSGNNPFVDSITSFIMMNSTNVEQSDPAFFSFIELMRKRAAFVNEVFEDKMNNGIAPFNAARERAVMDKMAGSKWERLFCACVVHFRKEQERMMEDTKRMMEDTKRMIEDYKPARIDYAGSLAKILSFRASHVTDHDRRSFLMRNYSKSDLVSMYTEMYALGKSLSVNIQKPMPEHVSKSHELLQSDQSNLVHIDCVADCILSLFNSISYVIYHNREFLAQNN